MNKPVAEFIGTFTLVFFGCGAAVIAGMGTGPTAIDLLGIAFAFGLAIVAMAYGIGPISGCHVNPAVSFGVLVAGRMSDRRLHRLRDRAGARRDRRRGRALSHPVRQGVGLDRRPRPERLGPGLSRRIQSSSPPSSSRSVATFLFLVCILGVTQQGRAGAASPVSPSA